MPLPYDYHMHTPLCHHAVGEPIDYAEEATKKGISEIGFSEHSPMEQDDFDEWRMYLSDINEYINKIKIAREAFPELRIKIGLEVDYIPGYESWIKHLKTLHNWDYFIGSVHYLDNKWDFDNPDKLDIWHSQDTFDVWRNYFGKLTQAAQSGLFHTIGHPDLCKKFAIYPKQETISLWLPFLNAVKENNIAIELNTAGNYKKCKEIYPHPEILKHAAKMDIPLSFASDAHAPNEVGRDWNLAVKLAKECGFKQFCAFDQGERSLLPLD